MAERAPRPDEELRQIGKDLYEGKIFTDRHCREANEIPMVFMVLALTPPDQINELLEKLGENPMIFEYMDKAGPRSVNGLPTFLSMQTLSTEETEKVYNYYVKFMEAAESV